MAAVSVKRSINNKSNFPLLKPKRTQQHNTKKILEQIEILYYNRKFRRRFLAMTTDFQVNSESVFATGNVTGKKFIMQVYSLRSFRSKWFWAFALETWEFMFHQWQSPSKISYNGRAHKDRVHNSDLFTSYVNDDRLIRKALSNNFNSFSIITFPLRKLEIITNRKKELFRLRSFVRPCFDHERIVNLAEPPGKKVKDDERKTLGNKQNWKPWLQSYI